MKAYQLASFAGPEGLQLVDRPMPAPGLREVLIRIRAASLNYRDLLVAQGKYGAHQRSPLIPLSDGAGEVAAVGDGVTRFRVGDRVAGCFFQGWIVGPPSREKLTGDLGGGMDGMLAEQVTLHEQGVVGLPEHLTYEEAATLPCAGVTAWQAVVTKGTVKAGDTVLVLGTGGVSVFALQFAKLHGARVIVTSSSDEKLQRVKALGADELINYEITPAWDQRVWELTERTGVDLAIEVGGIGTLEKSLNSVRIGGRIGLIGVLTGLAGDINLIPVLVRSQQMNGIYVGSRELFEEMNRAIVQSRLRPVIDRVFPFGEAREAYRYLQSGAHVGKVVIRVD
jgi:NADPH:quinone reductase-like Zn-dependent oxidoreductase